MLKARLLSAAIMVPLVVCGVLFLPTPVFTAILAAIMLLAAWEWSQLVPVRQIVLRIAYVLVMAVLMWMLWQTGLSQLLFPLLLLAMIWWLCALFWLSRPAVSLGTLPANSQYQAACRCTGAAACMGITGDLACQW